MIVVSDTSPITALLTVGEIELLQKLFDTVVIPVEVHSELLRFHPNVPSWIRVERVIDLSQAFALRGEVDPGEAEAIQLAKELRADRLLIDDSKGRKVAQREGVRIIGLLGITILAKSRGLVPLASPLIERLVNEADIYLDEEIVRSALKEVGE